MRQIQVCGWLVWAITACGGAEFSSPSTKDQAHPESGGGAASVSGAGSVEAQPASPASSGNASGGSSSASSAGASETASDDSEGGEGSKEASGGKSASLGAGGDYCPSGTITFRMLPSEKLEPGSLCDAGCGTGWLSITDKEGATSLPISSACGTASCEACEVQQCAAAACLATPLTSHGSELTWDGTYLTKDTCGSGKLVCQRPACVKPGKYKARACAARNGGASIDGGCIPQEPNLCKEIEFEFPSTETVELRLGD